MLVLRNYALFFLITRIIGKFQRNWIFRIECAVTKYGGNIKKLVLINFHRFFFNYSFDMHSFCNRMVIFMHIIDNNTLECCTINVVLLSRYKKAGKLSILPI